MLGSRRKALVGEDIIRECNRLNLINQIIFLKSFLPWLYSDEFVEYKIQEINKKYGKKETSK